MKNGISEEQWNYPKNWIDVPTYKSKADTEAQHQKEEKERKQRLKEQHPLGNPRLLVTNTKVCETSAFKVNNRVLGAELLKIKRCTGTGAGKRTLTRGLLQILGDCPGENCGHSLAVIKLLGTDTDISGRLKVEGECQWPALPCLAAEMDLDDVLLSRLTKVMLAAVKKSEIETE